MLRKIIKKRNIEAFCIVNEKGKYVFKPEIALNSEVFNNWLEDETKEKTVFDVKKRLKSHY